MQRWIKKGVKKVRQNKDFLKRAKTVQNIQEISETHTRFQEMRKHCQSKALSFSFPAITAVDEILLKTLGTNNL